MGTSLSGLLPQDTYQGLIKVGDNTAITSTLKTLSDGAGNNLPMQASSTGINFTGTTSGLVSGVSGAIQFSNGSAFASDAANFFWDDTNKRLGIGTNAPTTALHIVGQTTFSDNALFSADFKYIGRDLNNSSIRFSQASGEIRANISTGGQFQVYNSGTGSGRLTVTSGGQTTISGGGSTSATTSLLVQNSAGTSALQVKDDGDITNGADGNTNLKFEISPSANKYFRLTRQSTNVDFYAGNGGNAAIETSGGQPFSLIASSTYLTLSNGGVRIASAYGTTSASAQLEVVSTTKGFLPPRMTNAQRAAIASPAEGLILFNTDNKGVAYRDGTNWGYLSGAKQTVAASGGTVNVSFANGNIIDMTLTASTTLTLSAHVVGTYIFELIQGGSGSYTITWPASVKWSGGTAPTLTTTVGKTDIVTLFHDGTNFFGTYSLNY